MGATGRHEPSSGRQFMDVVLKAGQGAEQLNSGGIAAEGGAIAAREGGLNQGRLELLFWGPEGRILERCPRAEGVVFSHLAAQAFSWP